MKFVIVNIFYNNMFLLGITITITDRSRQNMTDSTRTYDKQTKYGREKSARRGERGDKNCPKNRR